MKMLGLSMRFSAREDFNAILKLFLHYPQITPILCHLKKEYKRIPF